MCALEMGMSTLKEEEGLHWRLKDLGTEGPMRMPRYRNSKGKQPEDTRDEQLGVLGVAGERDQGEEGVPHNRNRMLTHARCGVAEELRAS